MRASNTKSLRHLIVAVVILSTTAALAELTEAEKKALEAEKKVAELAAEAAKSGTEGGTQDGNQGGNEDPAEEVELTEAEKKALEAEKKAAEDQGGNQDQGGNGQATTGSVNGHISYIGVDYGVPIISVGIYGDSTFTFSGGTQIFFNGQAAHYSYLLIGDVVSVEYDIATNHATRIEAEGIFGWSSVYTDVTTVADLGCYGHMGLHYMMVTANGAGVKLGPNTQVTVDGFPATYLDIRVGDIVDYVQSALDLKAIFVRVTTP